jgi:hypothetical protein
VCAGTKRSTESSDDRSVSRHATCASCATRDGHGGSAYAASMPTVLIVERVSWCLPKVGAVQRG